MKALDLVNTRSKYFVWFDFNIDDHCNTDCWAERDFTNIYPSINDYETRKVNSYSFQENCLKQKARRRSKHENWNCKVWNNIVQVLRLRSSEWTKKRTSEVLLSIKKKIKMFSFRANFSHFANVGEFLLLFKQLELVVGSSCISMN